MKNPKRAIWFVAGVISSAALFLGTKKIQRERQKHQIILAQLRSNEDIMKIEDPGKTGIKFIKHPESKKYDDNILQWRAQINDVVIVPLRDDKFIIPSDKDKQFDHYFHEKGHLKNKDNGHFEKKALCEYAMDDCLLQELQAQMEVIESLKKIRKKFKKSHWLEIFEHLREDQCTECLKIIDKNKCPPEVMKKIEKYFDIIDRTAKIDSRKIIFHFQSAKPEEKDG